MKRFLCPTALVACLLTSILAGHAQDTYPTHSVKIVCGFPAGSSLDIITRLYADQLEKSLGQTFVVENRVGASGNIAAEAVARSAPDGYTLLTNGVTQAISVSLFKKISYNIINDFTPIGLLGNVPIILAVHESIGVNSVAALIALAKSKPGQLTHGSAGIGSIQHLSGELFNTMADVKLAHIPYRGTNQVIVDFLAGRLAVMFAPGPTIAPYLKDPRVKLLAVTTAKRSKLYPDIPTLSETGLPGYDTFLWNAIWAPKGTPKPVITAINNVVRKMNSTAEGEAQLARTGTEATVTTPEEAAVFLDSEVKKWAKMVEISGASVD